MENFKYYTTMLNKAILKEGLARYKKDFADGWWYENKFKWEAIQHFQNLWNIEASDVPRMIDNSLSATGVLLAATNFYPRKMIEEFGLMAPEKVRDMFLNLFDENKDVIGRIEEFKQKSQILFDANLSLLRKKYPSAKLHFQNEKVISTYLWLRYPDKYYIYRFRETKLLANILQSNYFFKQGAIVNNLEEFYSLYNEIREYVLADSELIDLFKSKCTKSCYPDPQYRTLTSDFCHYMAR